jgi:hypothetical protein
MLLGQFIAHVLPAAKWFDAVVLHAWQKVRELASWLRAYRQRELAD